MTDNQQEQQRPQEQAVTFTSVAPHVELLRALQAIQADINCPKSAWNAFGKYHFRNAETILENLKPLLTEQGLNLLASEEVYKDGNKYFVKSVIYLTHLETGQQLITQGLAQMDDKEKGLSLGQGSGKTGSYALKYNLQKLLLLDDNKDADSTEATIEVEKRAQAEIEENQKNYAIAKEAACDISSLYAMSNIEEGNLQKAYEILKSVSNDKEIKRTLWQGENLLIKEVKEWLLVAINADKKAKEEKEAKENPPTKKEQQPDSNESHDTEFDQEVRKQKGAILKMIETDSDLVVNHLKALKEESKTLVDEIWNSFDSQTQETIKRLVEESKKAKSSIPL